MAINSLYLIQVETTVKAEPNVRIRMRGAIIRIQITETRIRSIIRISRQQGTHDRHNPIFFQNVKSHFFRRSVIRLLLFVNYGTSGTQGAHP